MVVICNREPSSSNSTLSISRFPSFFSLSILLVSFFLYIFFHLGFQIFTSVFSSVIICHCSIVINRGAMTMRNDNSMQAHIAIIFGDSVLYGIQTPTAMARSRAVYESARYEPPFSVRLFTIRFEKVYLPTC